MRVDILMAKVHNNMAEGLAKMEMFYYTDKVVLEGFDFMVPVTDLSIFQSSVVFIFK